MAGAHPQEEFYNVEPHEWQLSDRVETRRKSRLLETGFREIAKRVAAEGEWLFCRRKELKKQSGSHRAELTIVLPSAVVDLFHNGAGGYRAQYYISKSLGEHANRYVIDIIYLALRSSNIPSDCEWDFVEASLKDSDAKIWIHEGAWLSDNRADDRNLIAAAWESNAPRLGSDKRFEASWVKLTPEKETKLEIKGGSVNAQRESCGIVLKPERSNELHDFGYT